MFDKRRKTLDIGIKMYDDDVTELKKLASERGLPLSTWIREMLLALLKKDKEE